MTIGIHVLIHEVERGQGGAEKHEVVGHVTHEHRQRRGSGTFHLDDLPKCQVEPPSSSGLSMTATPLEVENRATRDEDLVRIAHLVVLQVPQVQLVEETLQRLLGHNLVRTDDVTVVDVGSDHDPSRAQRHQRTSFAKRGDVRRLEAQGARNTDLEAILGDQVAEVQAPGPAHWEALKDWEDQRLRGKIEVLAAVFVVHLGAVEGAQRRREVKPEHGADVFPMKLIESLSEIC